LKEGEGHLSGGTGEPKKGDRMVGAQPEGVRRESISHTSSEKPGGFPA